MYLLFQTIQKIFTGQVLTEEEKKLGRLEKMILRSIFIRKLKNKDLKTHEFASVEQMKKYFESQTSRKRPEENLKFVFKRAIKYLK